MKRILMAFSALAVASTIATAGVAIQWSSQWGVYDNTQTPPLTGGAGNLLGSYSAIWQLIYAGPNNMIDEIPNPAPVAPTLGGAGIADNYVYGDDVVWGQREIPLGGGAAGDAPYNTSWNEWMLNTAGSVVYEDLSWSTAGFVYQRIFQDTPADKTWYYQSGLQALNTGYAGGGAAPELFYVDDANFGAQPTRQINVIPEPATMSLLGLGALAIAIRRRRS